mgnify:CR=1 FL=1
MQGKSTKEEKVKKREQFFKSALASFFDNNSVTLSRQISEDTGRNITIAILEDAHKIINDFYWEYIDNHIRTQINIDKKNEQETDTETLVDLYKILSATEYSIMFVRPLALFIDGAPIDYEKEHEMHGIELDLTGNFAFSCAFDILRNWDHAYTDIFQKPEVEEYLLNFREDQEFRKDAMILKDEHVKVVAYSSIDNTNVPVFSNATWWRLFCLCGVLYNKTLPYQK